MPDSRFWSSSRSAIEGDSRSIGEEGWLVLAGWMAEEVVGSYKP